MSTFQDVIVYHGSRGGIKGAIIPNPPSSKISSDFGQGFYMGTNPNQAKEIVANDIADKIFYKLKIKLSKFTQEQVLALSGIDWALFVLYNRNKINNFDVFDVDTDELITFDVDNSKLKQRYANLAIGKDFIVGPIADDSLFHVTEQFANNQITDIAFVSCIKAMNYGYQYVAKTKAACDAIEIIELHKIDNQSLSTILSNARKSSEKGHALASSILRNPKYRTGRLFSELIQDYEKGIDIFDNYAQPKTVLALTTDDDQR